ncbi:hypothetical protein Mapa_005701 [Marchantia paleacea]|nr:hypothetical protein Mapa_005701 [Marchantia paleacea]
MPSCDWDDCDQVRGLGIISVLTVSQLNGLRIQHVRTNEIFTSRNVLGDSPNQIVPCIRVQLDRNLLQTSLVPVEIVAGLPPAAINLTLGSKAQLHLDTGVLRIYSVVEGRVQVPLNGQTVYTHFGHS